MLALIGAAVALALAVWLWGGLAGAVFGSGWPRASSGQLLTVLVRLPARLGDPASAWPRGDARAAAGRRGLLRRAGGAGRRGACAVGVAARASVCWALCADRSPGARWASGGELRALHGAAPRRPAGAGALPRPAAVRRAASRAGRLRAAAVGQVGRAGGAGPAGVGRPGGRLLDQDRPAGLHSGPPARAGPGVRVRSVRARRACHRAHLVAAARGGHLGRGAGGGVATGRRRRARSARRRGRRLLGDRRRAATGAPALHGGAHRCRNGGGRALDLRAGHARARRRRLAADRLGARPRRSSRARMPPTTPCGPSRPRPTARAPRSRRPPRDCCAPIGSRRVLRSAQACEIAPDRLLDERATLYLIGDAKASKLLRPIFLALLSEIVDRAYERATLAGGRLELPLLLCLDEAGNVAPLPNLAEIASTAPSHNIQLVSIFHDLAQARSRYGKQAETVVNSHRARMLLPGRRRPGYAALLLRLGRRGGGARHDAHAGAPRARAGRAGSAPPAGGARGAAPAARRARAAALRAARPRPGAAADVVRRPAAAGAGAGGVRR